MTGIGTYDMFVGGRWTPASGGTFEDANPAGGGVFAMVADADGADATTAVDSAAAAATGWAALPHQDRSAFLHRAADVIAEREKEIVDLIIDEAGSWIGKAMFEAATASNILRTAAATAYQVTGEILPAEHGKLSLVLREPVGVVAVISPWNFPLLLSLRSLTFALATGNAVVLKPSEETPVSGGLLIGEIFEQAGLPAGVLNVVTCSRPHVEEVGEAIISHPAVGAVNFTGSSAVGRRVGALAGQHLKKVSLELGGKDPLLILDDADLDRAVDAATFGSFMHAGQVCMAVERVIVDRAVADEFTERFVAKARTLQLGDVRNFEHVISPIINRKQLDKIVAQLDDAVAKGAQILVGGTHDGLYMQPTVLRNVSRDMDLMRYETFGPIAPIIVVDGDDEAVSVANDCDYGLSSGVITSDEERGMRIARRLENGMTHINDCPLYDEPIAPFGGVKSSGVGRYGGHAAIDACTTTRWITLERGGRHYPF
jgi:aldehyde dehydrogenase (NAD+)